LGETGQRSGVRDSGARKLGGTVGFERVDALKEHVEP